MNPNPRVAFGVLGFTADIRSRQDCIEGLTVPHATSALLIRIKWTSLMYLILNSCKLLA